MSFSALSRRGLVTTIGGVLTLLLASCQASEVSLVRDGTLAGYDRTTIGKAFDASFDGPRWTSYTTPKGLRIVQFNGAISSGLHQAVVRQIRTEISKARQRDGTAFNVLSEFFQKAHTVLAGRPEQFAALLSKHRCSRVERVSIPGRTIVLPECAGGAGEAVLEDAVFSWAEGFVWPVGTPVEAQWAISADGRSFELAALNSKACEGTPVNLVLNVIYE